MKIPTQKKISKLMGVSENTLVNWGKQSKGRSILLKASKLYSALVEQDEIYKIIQAIENVEIICKKKESLTLSIKKLKEFKEILEEIGDLNVQ